MNKLKTNLVVAAAFAVLAIIGTIMNAQYATAQQQGPPDGLAVRLVSPLPLPVTGNVVITGTPTVNFGNTAANPLFVRNPDEPGRNPYQERKSFTFTSTDSCGGNNCDVTFGLVPAGKRLVVTDVSGELGLQGGASLLRIFLGTSIPNMRVNIPTNLESVSGAIQFRQFNQQVHLYVEASNAPEVTFELSTNPGNFFQSVALAGYYVNLP